MSLFAPSAWGRRLFDGGWRPASTYATATEPASGRIIGEYGVATTVDVGMSTAKAVSTQRDWASATYDARATVLRRAAAAFLDHADAIADLFARESGAPMSIARAQAGAAAEECNEAAALAGMPAGEVLRSRIPRLSFTRQIPVGVAGVIAPFNSPIVLAIRALAPALALGNACLLKPDPRTAVCGGIVFARIFEEAGLPDGLLHVLPGGAEVGQAIVDHPNIPVIAFTGSTRAGRAIAASAAHHLKRTHLELGGNSALIVLPDADIEAAAAAGAYGSFRHAGQICMATGRHLVHESVYDQYVSALARQARQLEVGDPVLSTTQVGPVIDASQRDHIHRTVTCSVDAGATLIEGGTYDGLYYRPTVLAQPPLDSPAYAEEIFGPVAPVVAFRTSDEAAALAADSIYGLALGVFTRDVAAGLNLAERIPTGLVHINDQTINDEPGAPFGGLGDSGNGSRHGGHKANLEAFTETQWITARGTPPSRQW